MGKFDGILLCTDFDSTLYVNGAISEENFKAIEYFKKNGGLFTIVSGRPDWMLVDMLGAVRPNTYVCGLNGSVIGMLDGSDKVYESFVEDGLKEYHRIICRDIPEIKRFHYFTADKMTKVDREDFSDGLIREHNKNDMYKITYSVEAEHSNSVVARISEILDERYLVTRSSIRGIEMQNACDCKGAAVKRLERIVGADTLVCVGDFENDISMIESADIGYAVGNACESLKTVADRITVSAENHALAKIIEDLG
ncbi:MAG: HAD-IIB family hydrolase [Clostridia bacterium]|nr:HAD-IIB family hydrolase [Clostridia bacterium]